MTASRRLHQLFILSLLLSVALVVGTVSAGEKKTIFYNLTTDEAWAAGMAIGQATKALDNGYDVAISLTSGVSFLPQRSSAPIARALRARACRT